MLLNTTRLDINMAAMEPLYHLVGIPLSGLLREEIILIEAELLSRICNELKDIFRKRYRDFFYLMGFTTEKENIMLDNMFVGLIIKDVLSTNEYNLKGIAHYTDSHEDVIQEVIDGRNTNPSAKLLRRSIDLHITVRRDLYQSIINKISNAILAQKNRCP